MNDTNILALFGIGVEDIERYELLGSDGDSMSILVRMRRDVDACHECGCMHPLVKEYKRKRYSFRSQTGIVVNIIYEHRRYECRACSKTFMEKNPFVKRGRSKLSPKKILEVINYLKDGLPITLVSRYSFLSESTVHNVLGHMVKVKRRKMPEVVSIDEFCSFNSDAKSKYACLLLDYKAGRVIDVLPSRRSTWLSGYLAGIPDAEMSGIRYVVMDMYRPYMDCFKRRNPKITFVIDPFHYIRYVTDAMERVRVRTMKSFTHDSVDYKLLKKYRRLLLSKDEPDSSQYARRLVIMGDVRMFDSEILERMLESSSELRNAYELCHHFLKQLDKMDYDGFKVLMGNTIVRFKTSGISEFSSVGETFENWREEICNSYIKVDGKRLSNAKIEGRNNKIKTLKKVSYGLTNFDHLKKRIFLIFDKDPTE